MFNGAAYTIKITLFDEILNTLVPKKLHFNSIKRSFRLKRSFTQKLSDLIKRTER